MQHGDDNTRYEYFFVHHRKQTFIVEFQRLNKVTEVPLPVINFDFIIVK